MNFQQEFNAAFGEKYNSLQLKSVQVQKNDKLIVINFLYPSTCAELSSDEKAEIVAFFKEKLNLEKLQVKVKFLRVFVEEKLIRKAIASYMEEKQKLANTYLNFDDIKISINPIDVIVSFVLSPRLNAYFAQQKISAGLAKFLKENFLVDFVIDIKEDENLVDDVDIENVQLKAIYKKSKHFNVEIVKDIVGKDIPTKPEYISSIKVPTKSVLVAGFIRGFERKNYIAKKGKSAGQEKSFFKFVLQDENGKIDCIYFASKSNERVMDTLEDSMYVVVFGDVELNKFGGRLCLNVSKMALASRLEDPIELEEKLNVDKLESVVEIENLTAVEQDSMFGQVKRYNNKITGRTIVVFDIETTGLSDLSDQIIELGAVKIQDGNIIQKFSTFVCPTVEIPKEVTELTGITNEMVKDAPPIENVIKDFYDFTRGCVLCGHNAINFDIKFIRREGNNLGLCFDNEIIDTMNEARVARLKISRFNLATVLNALGLVNAGAHRAWNDAYATAQVLLKLNEANA